MKQLLIIKQIVLALMLICVLAFVSCSFSGCGKGYFVDPPVHEHSYTAIVTAPTCTEQGYTKYICKCNDSYVDDYVDALGHSFSEWVTIKEATTTEEGLQERTCACGEKETQNIDKIQAYERLNYTINADGKSYSVTGIGTYTDDTKLVIPALYKGLPVTSIGHAAFKDSTSLTSVTIPDSVTSIDSYAFSGCTSLKSVTIGNSVTSIGYQAFSGCRLLTSIIIPDSVTTIETWAFDACISLNSLVIGESVTSIGLEAFGGCWGLKTVIIPESVTSIEGAPFDQCFSLANIEVDENNQHFKSIDGNLYSKDGKTLIQYVARKQDESFTIPDSVTSIGYRAFSCYFSLEDRYSEYDNALYLEVNNNPYFVLIGVISKDITNYKIHNETKFIYGEAFHICTSLTSITIPDSVTSIGDYAFDYCTSLTSVTMPDSVTSIGASAFSGCISLISINYGGTIEQWNDISKGPYWKASVRVADVICYDGTIALK